MSSEFTSLTIVSPIPPALGTDNSAESSSNDVHSSVRSHFGTIPESDPQSSDPAKDLEMEVRRFAKPSSRKFSPNILRRQSFGVNQSDSTTTGRPASQTGSGIHQPLHHPNMESSNIDKVELRPNETARHVPRKRSFRNTLILPSN